MADYKNNYTTVAPDSNAIVADKQFTGYDNIRVIKSGDSEDEKSSETGSNAAILVKNKSVIDITDSYITSTAKYGNGIFCKDEGTQVILKRNKIDTNAEYAPAITIVENGIIESDNNTISTSGINSPAVESKGNKIVLTGGSYTTNNYNSPTVSTTADVDLLYIDNLTAHQSDAIRINGNCIVNMQQCVLNVSGDVYNEKEDLLDISAVRMNSEEYDESKVFGFVSNGSTINVNSTAGFNLFDVANGKADIALTKTKITGMNSNTNLLIVERDTFENGGDVEFTANNQILVGRITVDEFSKLHFVVKNSSSFTGKINSNGQNGEISVDISNGSWTLTGDSYVSEFSTNDQSVLTLNGYKLYVNGKAYGEDEPDTPDNPDEEPTEFTETYISTKDDDNAYSITDDTAILKTVKVEKTGDSYEDDSDLYGSNAGVLAVSASLSITDKSRINTDGYQAFGVASRLASEVVLDNIKITTKGEKSDGILASVGGNITTTNITVETSGNKSPAIGTVKKEDSDDYNSYININSGEFMTHGENSPVVELKEDAVNPRQSISLINATLKSDQGYGIVINGAQKKVNIESTVITSKEASLKVNGVNDTVVKAISEKSTFIDGVEFTDATAELTFKNSNINKGINVENSKVNILANSGSINGDISIDSSSTLDIIANNSANIQGTINSANIKGGKISLTLKRSRWILTGDSYIDNLDVDKYSTIYVGQYTLYVSGVASNLVVGSVVNYQSEDKTVNEEDVVIIEKTTIKGETFLTLYDTDDRTTFNNVKPEETTFTGRVIDIEPILQEIDQLARNDKKGEVVDGDTIIVPASDRNAILLEGENDPKVYKDITIKKTGDSNNEKEDDNAAVLVKDGNDLTLENSTIETAATYSPGVVAEGENTKVTLNDVSIKTNSNHSNGISAKDKATVNGNQVKIETIDSFSDGIRVDHATVSINGGSISANGGQSYPVKVIDGSLTLSGVSIINNRSIPTIDITGDSTVVLKNGYIGNSSSEISNGGIYIHNELPKVEE